jgi:hypothetical protein
MNIVPAILMGVPVAGVHERPLFVKRRLTQPLQNYT